MQNIQINLDRLKKCLYNCKEAGDKLRDINLFTYAAIMIIFSLDEIRNQHQLIIIRRKKNLRKHGGQIAFPGGRYEANDKNLMSTSIRETMEEINIPENHLEILGSLPIFYTGTGYAVTPFLAIIKDK